MSVREYLLDATIKNTTKKVTKTPVSVSPADLARSHGLVHTEFGLWAKKPGGPAVASTKGGKFKWLSDTENKGKEKNKEKVQKKEVAKKPIKPSEEIIKWWNSATPEKQKKWIKENPNGLISKHVQMGQLNIGKKYGEENIGLHNKNVKFHDEHDKIQKDLERKSTKKESPKQGKNIIGGKDKTVKKSITPKNQPYFKETLYNPVKKDNDFYNKAKSYKGKDLNVPSKYNIDSFLLADGRVSSREVQIFGRMMNLKKADSSGTKPPISFITDGGPGGAGKLPAQAGEIMALLFATCETKEKAETLKKSIMDHLEKNKSIEKNMIITKDWVKAAWGQSEAILSHIKGDKTIDSRSLIEAGCWDTKSGVESLGFDYSQKGFSTDIFLRLKDKQGNTSIKEVSLKKDKNINFLNSGTGKFEEWYGKNKLPEDINIKTFQTKQLSSLKKHMTPENIKKVKMLLKNGTGDPDTSKMIMEKINGDIENLDSFIKNNNRKSRKVMFNMLEMLSKKGDSDVEKTYNNIKKMGEKYATDSINAICVDSKLKNGMMREITKEFPLKSCADGEEVMAIGNVCLDKNITKSIFGTNNWDEIKEDLVAITKATPPYLAYKAKGTKDYIPIANIIIREDGVGYGAMFKFEMTLNNDFYKILKQHNLELGRIEEEISIIKNIFHLSLTEKEKEEDDD